MDVVVVNHNTRDHLRACLSGLRGVRGTCVVVDNASTDGSVALVRRGHPQAVLVANERNLGYGAAANQGIARCRSEYVLLLNSDTFVQAGALDALSDYLDRHPRVAIVGPRIVDPGGRPQPSCNPFPTLFATFLVESTLGRLLRFVPGARERYLPTASLAAPRQVPWVLGAAMAIRRTAFEAVGGFDTSFFMYFEEVDLCYRLAQAGWQVHFAPVATVVHTGAASTRQYRTEMAVQAQASRLHFYWRHYPAWSAVALVILVDSLALLRWLLYPVRARLAPTAERRAQLAAERVAWARVLRGDWLRVRSAAG